MIVANNLATTQLNISNALDDSNNPIALLLNDSTVVQESALTGSATINSVSVQVPAAAVDGKTKIQLSTALDEDNVAHLSEAIWAIKPLAAAGRAPGSSPPPGAEASAPAGGVAGLGASMMRANEAA